MNVCGVTFGGYLTKILSFKTGNLLNNSKFHLLSEGTVCNMSRTFNIIHVSCKVCYKAANNAHQYLGQPDYNAKVGRRIKALNEKLRLIDSEIEFVTNFTESKLR